MRKRHFPGRVLFPLLVLSPLMVRSLPGQVDAQPAQVLPGTDLLEWEDPLDVRLMDGAHRYIEARISQALPSRARYWKRDLTSSRAYELSVAPNRERFKTIIGAVNLGREINHNIGLPALQLPIAMERIGRDEKDLPLGETDRYRVWSVRWPVLRGVHGEGLLLEPRAPARAHAVLLPDADQQPEQMVGLAPGMPPEQQVARRLVENGVRVIVPVLVDRSLLFEGERRQTRREWIYRQAFHMGRHIIGYEVEKVQAAVSWLEKTSEGSLPIGVAGYGEGGLIAFYTAAIDARIDAALVSGYFGPREAVWSEPIYRNVWSLLGEFGDAEIASLIAPRALAIEFSEVPEVRDQKGELRTPAPAAVVREFNRIQSLVGDEFQPLELIRGGQGGPTGPWSDAALLSFLRSLQCPDLKPASAAPAPLDLSEGELQGRQLRMVWELDDYTQRLVRDSDHVRNDFYLYAVHPEFRRPRWSTEPVHPTVSPESFIEESRRYRAYLWEEILGKLDDPPMPFNPRTRLVADRPHFVAYDVVLDVFPELIAWGILFLPKDLREGEKRPVVVLQHGRNGLPVNLLNGAYNNAAPRLLERGFIVFAPHNLYRGEDRYRWLDRKANSVKASLFSFIIAQHDQITRWLASLAFVDGDRIAFYGNSYGGETAVRVPTILSRYALSICASDFNDWTRKVADTHDWHSFMGTIEWEMPYFNMGSTFSYGELAYLMLPRPFMVERGHHDTVAPDSWVAYEFAKVRWLYDQFGLQDRRHIEFFQGGHTMRGNESFDFLHRHLNWPPPAAE